MKHVLLIALVALPGLLYGAVFSGNARVEVADPSGGLSWTNSANALTVACWFKLAVPSDKTLTENMTILVNRKTGNESSLFAYLIRYNIANGNVEFLTLGTSGLFTDTLIAAPYLERWYHVAVVRQGEVVKGYVDGREAFNKSSNIGSAANSDGVSIGGWGSMGSGCYLYGEVQEVSVYQAASGQEFISQYMFRDQPLSETSLRGYYRLAYSTNATDQLRNFAATPPTNTTPAVVAGSGQVTFEETNQAGEQSSFDSRKNGGSDSLAPLSGGYAWSHVLLARPVPGIAFDLRMAYSSANAFNGYSLGGYDPFASSTLGKGWRHSFEARVIPSQYFSPVGGIDTVGLMSWDGAIETWDKDSQTGRFKSRHNEYRGELNMPNDSMCEWVTPERIFYRFRHPFSGDSLMRGRLMEIVDSNSNKVVLAWNETVGVVTQVTDTVGGRYRFNYNAQYQITNISFQGWSANFVYDAQNRLVTNSLTTPAGYSVVNTARSFTYDEAGLLSRITDPRGHTDVTVTYDKYGRMTNQVDALNRATRTEYGVPAKRQITRTDSESFKWIETYDRKGRVTENRDPLGNATRNTYDVAGNIRTVTDPRGSLTTFDYDERANVLTNLNTLSQKRVWTYHPYYNKPLTETDPLGWTTRYDYDAAGNMTNQWDGLGSLVRYAYDGKGLVSEATDANGNVTRFGYDANGFQSRTIDPAGYTNAAGRNELGWTLTATNALGQVTTFAYDVNGNVIQTTDPLYRVITSGYDANGNLVSQSDAKGQVTRSFYDAANQRTQTVDRAGAGWLTAYTPRGEVWKVTDPQSNAVVNVYDAANRLVRVTDPLGGSVSNVYDAAGNPTESYDKLGQRWRKTYDRLNRVVAEQDPMGNTRRVTFDAAGRLDTVTSPNGFVSTHRYDGRGRLIRWVDAEGYVWLYAYDSVGSITNITDALGGHYIMTYGPRNERTLERNQDNFEWRYAYDALLRPERQNDPNGLVRSVVYDDGGRVDYVGFSTGRTDDYQYDENDNLTLLSRSRPGQAPTPTSLVYDLMDRPTQVTDAFGKTVKYAYDSLSRVDTLTYPGSRGLKYRYDALSRLTNQTDWASRRLDYAFDKANRLTSRRYPNGIVQTNGFDNAGRIASLDYSLNKLELAGIPKNGLVAKWSFEQGSGADSSGNGNALTVSGATPTSGKRGDALYFDELGLDSASIAPFNAMPTNEVSVCFWLRSSLQRYAEILNYYTTSSAEEFSFGELTGLGLYIGNENKSIGIAVNDGQWHHMGVTWRGSDGRTKLYIDGTNRWSATYSSGVTLINGGAFFIGQEQDAYAGGFSAAQALQGDLDEFVLYGRELSADEIILVMNAGGLVPQADVTASFTYAYDRNGNKTSSTEKGTLDWPQPTRIDETARYTAAGRLIDRMDAAGTNAPWAYHYDDSGNMTNAVGTGQSFTLTYDEDNRVLSVDWECGLTSKRIENRYDALGRRVSRKVDGVETRYVLDLQGGMERILCDTTAAGQITATYIHGADLSYKVDSSDAFICYHADAQANIIAMTDSGGTNIAQYAYTPYGRSLGSSAQAAAVYNPYRYVGSQGVMEELPGFYFMRARYYSAEAGVFLSTDPVKHIGPGWKPVAFGYADGNPLTAIDATGEELALLIFSAWRFEQTFVRGIVLPTAKIIEAGSEIYANGGSWDDFAKVAVGEGIGLAAAAFGVDVGELTKTSAKMALSDNSVRAGFSSIENYGLGVPTIKTFQSLGRTLQNYFNGKDRRRALANTGDSSRLEGMPNNVGGNGQQSIQSQKTPFAATYGQKSSDIFSTATAQCTSHKGTSTSSGNSSGGSIRTAAAKAVETVKAKVATVSNNVASSVKQSVSSVVKSVKSVISKIFSKGKKK